MRNGRCDNLEYLECGADGVEREYRDHTSQNTYTREQKHLKDLDGKLEGSVLTHARRKDNGFVPDFRINVT